MHLSRILPAGRWLRTYDASNDLRPDLAAGLTIGAMLVPQAMAYALLAGLPPEVGLYASTIPVLLYALFGTSRQLAVGPVAIVSLVTASSLAPLVEEGTAGYLAAAALLALMVGVVHIVLGVARLGAIVNFLSHSVLVGFTAAAAIIIGFSQVKHLLGVKIPRSEHFHDSFLDTVSVLGDANVATLMVAAGSIAVLVLAKRYAPRLPAALLVVVASILAVKLFDLTDEGVSVVGEIPDSLPAFGLPDFDGGLIGSLVSTAFIITLVGFMESIAVAKVYAKRYRYDVDPNQELVALGAANVGAGLFGGYPVTGGFSRTAVNDAAGAKTPLASIVTAGIVLATIAFFTPLLSDLPNAALGAIIIMAVIKLIDWREMRHIAKIKRSDLVGLGVAFVATLALGIELGIAVAVVASLLVVFLRMSKPHSAVLGRLPGTTTYRNVERFPEAETVPGVTVLRIDASLAFVNAEFTKKLLLQHVEAGASTIVLDCSGVNDIDATGAEMLGDLVDELERRGTAVFLADVKGPVRDVLRRSHLWDHLALLGRVHPGVHDAVAAITGAAPGTRVDTRTDARAVGLDERDEPSDPNDTAASAANRELGRV